MVRALLIQGMLAGVLAGLLAFGCAWVFGEPQIDLAIGFEQHTHLQRANTCDPSQMGCAAANPSRSAGHRVQRPGERDAFADERIREARRTLARLLSAAPPAAGYLMGDGGSAAAMPSDHSRQADITDGPPHSGTAR
jgi:hypothetical protein